MANFKSLTRRTAVKGLMVGAVGAIAAPAYIRSAWAQQKQLVVADFPGSVRDARRKVLYDPFTKETGIEIIHGEGPSLAAVKVQVDNKDVVWDVIRMDGSFAHSAAGLGLLERVDETIVNREGAIAASMHEYAVGTSISAAGIAFPTDRLQGKAPQTWPEFWDAEKFPGRRGLRDRITDTLEIALMGDGVPASQVYPCDIERAFKALDKIKPHVSHWIAGAAETVSLIQQNETDFTATYTSRVKSMQEANVPMDFSFKQNVLGVGYWAALKGARNLDAAMRFMAFTMREDRQIELAALTADAPVFDSAMAKLDPAVMKWMPDINSPDNLFVDPTWWDGHLEELTLRFQTWLLT